MVFGWFAPKSPLETREKAWTEVRMRWVAEEFGWERLRRSRIVLPTEEFFPEPYDATPEAAGRVLERVAGYLNLPSGPLRLEVLCEEDAAPTENCPAGTIRLSPSELSDPATLVATLADELSLSALAEKKSLSDAPDLLWLIDLLPVCCGMGVFMANATHRRRSVRNPHGSQEGCGQEGHKHDAQCGHAGHGGGCGHGGCRPPTPVGYLPARMVGYGLALFAWVRGEERPGWAEFLCGDARSAFRSGLKYLQATGDSCFARSTEREPASRPLHLLIERVESDSPSGSVAALWEIAERGPAADAAVSAVGRALQHRSGAIRAEAARALGALGPAAKSSLSKLTDALHDGEDEVRGAAAYALGRLAPQSEAVVEELADRINDSSRMVTQASVLALAQLGTAAQPALPRLMEAMRRAILTTDFDATDHLAYAIRAIAADAERQLQELVAEIDAESQAHAVQFLERGEPINTAGPGAWFGLVRW